MTRINCIFIDRQIYCTNKNIKKKCFGLLKRECIDSCAVSCPYKTVWKKPPPPPLPPPTETNRLLDEILSILKSDSPTTPTKGKE